MEIDQS